MTEEKKQDAIYIVGDSDHERLRLQDQAARLAPLTRRLFEDAGVGSGMRVLDVGSGAGDVAFLAAEMVGPTGYVLGVDKNPESWRRRAAVQWRKDLITLFSVPGMCARLRSTKASMLLWEGWC